MRQLKERSLSVLLDGSSFILGEINMNTRRDFLKTGVCAAGAVAFVGCTTGRRALPTLTANAFSWGALLHLGSNMWRDWVPGEKYPTSAQEEAQMVREGKIKFTKSHLYCVRDYMSADMAIWRRQVDCCKNEGLNTVFIDIGEAYSYPSHPELWVKGGLDFDAMRTELAYIRSLGLEPVPKLNFSTGHDQWLREYHYKTSTPEYYKVVGDLIRDVCEVFDGPRLFHIGYDEEIFAACSGRRLCVMRTGDLWWKDLLLCVKEVERNGSRAMLWSDGICGNKSEYLKRMPKSVLQVPWYYGKDFSAENLVWKSEFEKLQTWKIQRNLASALVEIAKAGYDVMPCTSNWSSDEAADAMLGFCKSGIDPERIKGFFTAPWLKPVEADHARTCSGIKLFAEAKRKYYP